MEPSGARRNKWRPRFFPVPAGFGMVQLCDIFAAIFFQEKRSDLGCRIVLRLNLSQ
jgi:hypothetical protein